MNKILKKLSLFHYNIGFFDYNPENLSQGECSVAWLRHPYKDRFFADPFILSVDDDEIKVLVEDFEYRRWKGCILPPAYPVRSAEWPAQAAKRSPRPDAP